MALLEPGLSVKLSKMSNVPSIPYLVYGSGKGNLRGSETTQQLSQSRSPRSQRTRVQSNGIIELTPRLLTLDSYAILWYLPHSSSHRMYRSIGSPVL